MGHIRGGKGSEATADPDTVAGTLQVRADLPEPGRFAPTDVVHGAAEATATASGVDMTKFEEQPLPSWLPCEVGEAGSDATFVAAIGRQLFRVLAHRERDQLKGA